MPLQVSAGGVQNFPLIDLASLTMQQRQLTQQKQQQNIANIMAIAQAIQQAQQFEQEQINKKREYGLLERETKIKEQPKLDELFNAIYFSPTPELKQHYLDLYQNALQTKYPYPNTQNQVLSSQIPTYQKGQFNLRNPYQNQNIMGNLYNSISLEDIDAEIARRMGG